MWFWSNHFCVSADVVTNMAGGYEREAVRAHVLGRFGDMLQAVEAHPAMLVYLDNFRSIGPKSVAGLIGKTGLNENLGREILELHTLGVRTVYSQDDVTNFAKVITGWTLRPMGTDPDHGNEFVFNPRLHEPGPQTIIGKTYPEGGMEQGKAVLADLARHPATAAHVAVKLARHFCADEPPDSLTARLSRRFLDTEGDLKEVARALIEAPETWDEQRTKLKRPSEWLMSAWRAIGTAPEPRRVLDSQAYFGERLWRPVAPAGFSDLQAAWLDGLAQRLDIANRIADRVGNSIRARRVPRHGARLARLGRDAPDHRARGKPPAGADARADVTRIPEEIAMAKLVHAATRRELLAGAGVLFAWPFLPKLARAEGRDPRLLTIILRGALDGLAAVAPVGDPDWVKLRGDRALLLDGKTPALPLDGFFALNAAMPNFHRLYQDSQAAIVHACATPYRERSHFDGQDVLESGLPKPGRADTGWLYRALGGIVAEARVRRENRAFAVGPVTPLVVRGPTPVMSWTPTRIQPASEDTMARLIDLYHHTDLELARGLEGRRDLALLARGGDPTAMAPTEGRQLPQGFPAQVRAFFAETAGTAASSWRARMGRASALSPSTAGTRMRMRARTRAASPRCSVRSTARSRRSRRTWVRRGARPS